MLRTNTWIIQPGGNRMDRQCLAIVILQYITCTPMQNTNLAAGKRGCVLTNASADTSSFHPNHIYLFIFNKRMEQTHRITTTANTGNKIIWQSVFLFQYLLFYLSADHQLEI